MNTMSRHLHKLVFLIGIGLLISMTSGCAEGILWRSGQWVPWARNQWAEEEKLADTLFAKKRRMNELVLMAENRPVETQTRAAEELAKIVRSDPVLLTRLHAVKLLGRLDCPAAVEALTAASTDHDADVRIAAVQSWKSQPAEIAIPQLQELIGSDTNVDVRLAATKALARFPGSRSVQALAVALNDPDPALQVRAAESLERATGEKLGRDVPAWKKYVQQSFPTQPIDAGIGTKPRIANSGLGTGNN